MSKFAPGGEEGDNFHKKIDRMISEKVEKKILKVTGWRFVAFQVLRRYMIKFMTNPC